MSQHRYTVNVSYHVERSKEIVVFAKDEDFAKEKACKTIKAYGDTENINATECKKVWP